MFDPIEIDTLIAALNEWECLQPADRGQIETIKAKLASINQESRILYTSNNLDEIEAWLRTEGFDDAIERIEQLRADGNLDLECLLLPDAYGEDFELCPGDCLISYYNKILRGTLPFERQR